MQKEELQKMKVAELAAICKDKGIPHYRGKNRFKKDELVVAILGAEVAEDGKDENDKSATDEVKIDNQDVEVGSKEEKKLASVDVDMKQKMPYIEAAEVGTIVAFRLPNGKVKSAKIVKKSTKKRRFMLETDYGASYVVNYEDIVWVRTGQRWPRGVYELLKGLVTGDEVKAN